MDKLEIRPDGPSHLFKNDNSRIWGLGQRFEDLIVRKKQTYGADKIEKIAEANYDLQQELLDAYKNQQKQLCTILCPPCRCAIRDALIISGQSDGDVLGYTVRIDDRIPASCCTEIGKLQLLRTFAQRLCEYDEVLLTEPDNANLLKHIDRSYLEQRIYDLETKAYENERYLPIRPQVSQLFNEGPKYDNIAIYMGEAITCSWIIQTAPFVWSPRVPKERELFRFLLNLPTKELRPEYL